MADTEQELIIDYFVEVFRLQNDGVTTWERSAKGMMKREFGSPEGSRSYYMTRKVKSTDRRK